MSPQAELPLAVDVLVVGSGIAGLSAAVEAARIGHRVLVLEAADEIGGASVMSGAACCLVDTPLQRRLGIRDSVPRALRDWAEMGGPTADLDWAERYLRASREQVHDWLATMGVEWVAVDRPEGNSVPRWHVPAGWGRRIVEILLDRATALEVDIRTGVPVTELVTDGGRVAGVGVGAAGVPIRAGAVIMATGGYVADLSRVLAHAPALATLPRLLAGGAPTATGAGHDVLARVGASFRHLENVWVYPTGTPDPRDPGGTRGVGVRGLVTELWLSLEGRRFHDETARGGRSGTRALLAQPGMTCWSIFRSAERESVLLIDNEFYGTPAGPDPVGMKEFWTASGHVRTGTGPAGIAAAIGLPPAAATAIEAFNDAVSAGAERDPATGRTLSGLSPLSGELTAIQLFPMAQKNFGGVGTDAHGRVIGKAGTPIPGLFAAGEVAGMAGGSINGAAALEGTMFGPSVWSGRLAGAAAAAELTGR